MPKKWPWFLDWHDEKHIIASYKLLGYQFIILWGPIALYVAISDRTKVTWCILWLLCAVYSFIMGAGVVLRKDWGRRLLFAYPFVALLLVFALVAVPEAILQHDIISALTFFVFLVVVCIPLIFAVKYFNKNPKLKEYFNK